MSCRGGGGAPGACWLGRALRGLRAGGGGRLVGIWVKCVADRWGDCLSEGGMGVVGGGLAWGTEGGAFGTRGSLEKWGGAWRGGP